MKLKGVYVADLASSPKSRKRHSANTGENSELKITKISRQLKRPDRYSIYINDKYAFSLHEYQIADSGVRIGRILSQDELKNFETESQFGKAYQRSLNYVMIRPRSEKEIKDYLTRTFLYPKPRSYTDKDGRRHFKKQTVDTQQVSDMIRKVTERLQEKGYINDESFALSWVSSRQIHKKLSYKKLEQELRGKGINPEIVAATLRQSGINEKDTLVELVAKKRRLTRYQDEVKLTQYLLRQGFRYENIKEVL